jgi:hypothetical protein
MRSFGSSSSGCKIVAMRRVRVVAIALVLAGCALDLSGSAWKKPGAMFQQVTADEMECARQTYEIGTGPDLVLGGLLDVLRLAVEESRHARTFQRCMASKGYARAQ